MGVLCFAHHKGGTGKTTTCINVAGFGQRHGLDVLVVDLDPQANATSGLGVAVDSVSPSTASVLAGKHALADIRVNTRSGIHLAPASLDLVEILPHLYSEGDQGYRHLEREIEALGDGYDAILVDTPPGAGVLMLNGIAAADRGIVTLDPGIFALEDLDGLEAILGRLGDPSMTERMRQTAVVTRVEKRSWLDRALGRPRTVDQILPDLRDRFEDVHEIPFDPSIFESHRQGLPLSHLGLDSPATVAYKSLARDVIRDA